MDYAAAAPHTAAAPSVADPHHPHPYAYPYPYPAYHQPAPYPYPYAAYHQPAPTADPHHPHPYAYPYPYAAYHQPAPTAASSSYYYPSPAATAASAGAPYDPCAAYQHYSAQAVAGGGGGGGSLAGFHFSAGEASQAPAASAVQAAPAGASAATGKEAGKHFGFDPQLYAQVAAARAPDGMAPPLSNTNQMAPYSSLSLALMAYLAILYEHLADRTLADAAEGHCAKCILPPLSEVIPEHMMATFRRLDILLRHVFRVVSLFRRANLAIDVVLENDVARLQEDSRRLDGYIETVADRVYRAETPRAREESLWAHFDLVLESERLWATLERARQRLDVFRGTYADPEPSDADNVAYEELKTLIAVYLGR